MNTHSASFEAASLNEIALVVEIFEHFRLGNAVFCRVAIKPRARLA